MNLEYQAGASPLAARGNFIVYAVLIIALLIIGFFFILWILKNQKMKKMEDPKWIEEQKKRPTKTSDVRETCIKYNLSSEEGGILLWLCKTFKIPNIFYSIRNFEEIKQFFEDGYKKINESWPSHRINTFFLLRFDVEKISAESSPVSSTNVLPENHPMILILENSTTVPCKIARSTKENLYLQVNDAFFDSDKKPAELSKVGFSFVSPSGLPYIFVTRITRYETNEKGEKLLIVPQSTNLIPKAQRHYKRIQTHEKCNISSVKETVKKGKQKIFVPSEKKIECALQNLSGGGCSINTTLPIKEGQKIFIELNFNGSPSLALGKIVKTRKAKNEGSYNLHIQFIKITEEVQNSIYEMVYGYNK